VAGNSYIKYNKFYKKNEKISFFFDIFHCSLKKIAGVIRRQHAPGNLHNDQEAGQAGLQIFYPYEKEMQ